MGTSADSIRVVGEGDLLEVARVARSTWQNWARQKIISPAPEGLHHEDDVIEAVVVGQLTAVFDLRTTKTVWRLAHDEVLAACGALPLDEPATLDAVVDVHTWATAVARDPDELAGVLHARVPYPRGRYVLVLGEAAQEARQTLGRAPSRRRSWPPTSADGRGVRPYAARRDRPGLSPGEDRTARASGARR